MRTGACRPVRRERPACGRYSEAAELRERLRAAKEAAEEAASRRTQQQASVEPRRLRLGQRVAHTVHGYRGVICGSRPRLLPWGSLSYLVTSTGYRRCGFATCRHAGKSAYESLQAHRIVALLCCLDQM